MATGPGYNVNQYAPQGAGAQTMEQWIADMASQYTVAYANGTTSAFDQFPNAFADTFWATMGLPPLPKESWGATAQNPNNVINPGVYSGLHLFFTQLASHPQNAQASGITVPQLPFGGAVTDDLGRTHQFTAGQNDANRQNSLDQIAAQTAGNLALQNNQNAFEGGENAADRAHQMAVANLQEAGMTSRQANELANRMSIAQLQEAGQDKRVAAQIAAQEIIAARNDATQRYGIDQNVIVAGQDRISREGIASADRTSRETIAGADRAENARQFDLNLGEDRRQFNSTMLLDLFDRGIELMKNPVDWIAYQYYLENLSIPLTALNFSAVSSALGAAPPTGPSEVGPMTGGPAIIDGDFAAAQAVGVPPAFVPMSAALQANPGDPGNTVVAGQTASVASAQWGEMTQLDQQLAQSRSETLPAVASPNNPAVAQSMQQGVSMGAPVNQGQPGVSVNNLTPPPGQPQPMVNQSAISTGMPNTGQPMEQLIRQMAQNLGISEADAWKVSGGANTTPGYSKEAIANAPVIQALKNGAQTMSQFRTGTAPNTASPTASATGPGLGLRGGQDLNAQLLINNTAGNKGLIQGAVMADGHYWDDFVQQSLKASPISSYDTGAFGRRR